MNYQFLFHKDNSMILDINGDQVSFSKTKKDVYTHLKINGSYDEKGIYFEEYQKDSDKGSLKKGDILFKIDKITDSRVTGNLNRDYELLAEFQAISPLISDGLHGTVSFYCDKTGNTQ